LAINTLWGGSDVALKSHWGGLAGHSAFFIRAGVALGGFARPFKVQGSRFEVQSSVFRASLGVLW
jgi:hypothetical protein